MVSTVQQQQEGQDLRERKGEMEDMDKSSVEDASISSTSQSRESRKGFNGRTILAERESKFVAYSKVLVIVVLLLTTAGAATATFLFIRQSEHKNFLVRFEDFANQVVSVTSINIGIAHEVYDNFGKAIANHAHGTNQEWPFVTYPRFEAQAQDIIAQTGARHVLVVPFVQPEQKQKWENYSVANQGWIQDGMNYHNDIEGGEKKEMVAVPISPTITVLEDGQGPMLVPSNKTIGPVYAPIWQTAPAGPSAGLVNYDSFDNGVFGAIYDYMENVQQGPVLSQVVNLDTQNENGEYNFPESFFATPILDNNSKIVGVIGSRQPWHRYFFHVLPDDIDSIIMVVENGSCGQVFTFDISGSGVTFLGVGDHHDTRYDGFEVIQDFDSVKTVSNGCSYTFHLFPSEAFENTYGTHSRWYYTGAVIAMFLLTTLVFVLYDCFVERRQLKVMTTATKTGAIVDSLFPSNVRDRLLVSDDPVPSSSPVARRHRLAGYVNPFGAGTANAESSHEVSTENNEEYGDMTVMHQSIRDAPIADLFPHTTVLFADIVGFTSWAASREPSDVFMLLETLYNSFDQIAKQRRVFKIETIGDCYVAVTGLPKPRKDHAVIMAKFSSDCLEAMDGLLHDLKNVLGDGTEKLSMRFGLHSGPVTAGVLRGEKSRFQLFGVTVNIAAKMESSGAKNQVHLSQAAADLIVEGGYGHMVRPREDKVMIKGTGNVSTYWLIHSSIKSSSSSNKNGNEMA